MRIFNIEFSKIGEAAIVLAFFTFLSQILGIFRDRFLAGHVGTGELLDIYYAAFRIPDLLFTLGAALVSVSILMPYFSQKLNESRENAKDFIHNIFSAFFVFMIALSVILYFLLPYLNQFFYPGFAAQEIAKVTELSRIMLLSPIILGVSSLFSTITQTFKKFFVYALAPIFYNLGIILGIIFIYPLYGIKGLALGVIVGALLHMLIQLPVVLREGFAPRLKLNFNWQDIKNIVAHSLPRTITLSLTKIVFLVFVSIASTLIPGAISVFNLSYNLQSVPLAIIGVSYSVAAFPILVSYYNEKNYEKFIAHVMGPIRQIVFWSLPIISMFIILRAQIVRVILGSGEFDWSDTRLTAASLALFIISVVGQSIILLLVRAYYASGKTWKPLWISLVGAGSSVAFAYIFLYLFNNISWVQEFFEGLLRIENVPGSSVVMLSLAFSSGVFVQLVLLMRSFRKDHTFSLADYGINKSFRQSLFTSLLMAFVAYAGLNMSDSVFNQESTLGVLTHGLFAGLLALTFGAIFLLTIKNQDFLVFLSAAKKKIYFYYKKIAK